MKDLESSLIVVLQNTDLFPFFNRARSVFWIVDKVFGIGVYNHNIIVQYNKERRVFTPKTFFLKSRLTKPQEEEVRKEIDELLLFVEQKHGTLRARDITRCQNAEYRRILLDRFGYEKFLREMGGIVVHRDRNSSLVKVDWHKNEEPMKLVRVKDASTDRWYVLRVPPDTKTCREALAWGFDMNESEYHPVEET